MDNVSPTESKSDVLEINLKVIFIYIIIVLRKDDFWVLDRKSMNFWKT